ncbi:trafficking protein particle complex subunit 14-like [Haliotis asinina]|uniref:trafficking protein particle complex subunit 14-like n=1 Tax=Haliotis asinina TaxID=109174 RepID=UPI00353265D5
MEDEEGDLRNVQLVFPQNGNIENYTLEDLCDKKAIYVGEAVESAIIVTCPNENQKEAWKRRITQLAGHCCFGQINNSPNKKTTAVKSNNGNDSFVTCSVSATYNTAIFNRQPLSAQPTSSLIVKPYFFNDNTFILPLQTVLNNLSTPCNDQKVLFSVTVWLCASPAKPTPDQEAKKDFQLNSFVNLKSKTVQEKTVSKELTVINPPVLGMKHVPAGGSQLLLLQVNNTTGKSLLIHDCSILPNKKEDKPEATDSDSTDNENPFSRESGCGLISPLSSDSVSFPVTLLSQEKLSLAYTLSTDDLDAEVMEQELTLKGFLKWSHKDVIGEKPEIITVFNLPKLRIRRAPFTVSITGNTQPKVGESFTLTYNIVNRLQDFLSMKLYWNVETQLSAYRDVAEDVLPRKHLEDLKNSVVCHDPDVYVGACPRGCTMPVSVSFQLLKTGLYEFGEMMKVNLRYALPDSQSTLKQDSVGTPVSIDTPSTLSAEDQLAASEELWRDRSGSTSSLHTPTTHSAEERRKTFATKSYSFGDLGPTLSTDSDEAQRIKFKTIKRSSAVPPPRPPPPRLLTQIERDVTNPANFLKKNFEIYVP